MVPDFQSLMLPVLERLSSGGEQASSVIRQAVSSSLSLSAEDLATMLPSGRQTTFGNRVAWALSYLKQAGLAESPRRGIYRITSRGAGGLAEHPDRIDIQYLMRFQEFVAFRTSSADISAPVPIADKTLAETTPLTPDEQIRLGYSRLKTNLAAELLERVRQVSPQIFRGTSC